MPLSCTFALNSQAISWFTCPGVGSIPAFSGDGPGLNNPRAAATENGAIPPGRYYIVQRVGGGRLGWLYDSVRHKDQWFALYRDDDRIDDWMSVDGVTRCCFRLHPVGPRRVSYGCITVLWLNDYNRLHDALLRSRPITVGAMSKAYGTVEVK
jgi:hypothetical protein